ncbi:hypothetical protein [Roseateles puraquae]|jgi:hypothetical protein|uniref:hypothetical protein n=1 Tax=Roseateles puraquae TaxID=431059 RepID=UPI0031DE3767
MPHALRLLAASLASLPPLLAAAPAGDFAPQGTRATLTVDFTYQATGRRADKYDSREWKVLRTLHMDATVTARQPALLAMLSAPEAEQTAKLKQQAAEANRITQQAAPMMAGAEAIMAKCGDDDKCLEREAMKLGQAMAGQPQVAATAKAMERFADNQAAQANRYQAWTGQSQTGSYRIEEKVRIVHADPICMSLPTARCTRIETRGGEGRIKLTDASTGAVELDLAKGLLTIHPPMSPEALAYTETVVTDEPEGTHSVPTPRGAQLRQGVFLKSPGNGTLVSPSFTVPLKGGWRSQSGIQTVPLGGKDEASGTLTMKWRFQVQ